MINFHNIPESFPFCRYSIDVSWSYFQEQIKGLSDGIGLDMDPPYQRGHVWTLEQQIAYVEYILRGGTSGKDIYWNAKGWMYENSGPLELVDGKQRLNAVASFMDNHLPVFDGHYFTDFSGRLRQTTASFKFHVNNLENDEEVVRWYLGMNTGGSAHTLEDLQSAYDHLNNLTNG